MFLPLFPLELVVFPDEKLKLHIFEPRYKQLIRECRDSKGTFGIPPFLKGKVAEYGTEMDLVTVVREYPDGEMDIVTQGRKVFHLERLFHEAPQKLYPAGEVAFLDNDGRSYTVTRQELAKQYAQLHKMLKSGFEIRDVNADNLSFLVGQHVGFSVEQKIQLLSMPKEADRELLIVQHLHSIIPVLQNAEDMKRKIKENGHFKRFPRLYF